MNTYTYEYLQGVQAYADGMPRLTCPYPANSNERDYWLYGWDDEYGYDDERM